MGAHHGHSHAHADAELQPAQIRGRKVLAATVLAIALATLAGLVLLWPAALVSDRNPYDGKTERVNATLVEFRLIECDGTPFAVEADRTDPRYADLQGPGGCVQAILELTSGPDRDKTIAMVVSGEYDIGQKVVLQRTDHGTGNLPDYRFHDVQRGTPLILLGLLFAAAVIGLGRVRGIAALAGMGLSLLILVKFLVPAIVAGNNPTLVAVVGASAVMLTVLVLAHGPSIRTGLAIVGTATSLLLVLGLATLFTHLSGLTGLTDDASVHVESLFGTIDLRGLLLAGIVIGALGSLDDVTVTQVSTVWELRAADPHLPLPELYAAALRVGRDHIASAVNTLLLAYAGAALPTLILLSVAEQGLVGTLTGSLVATEIVRTLAGSIGLVAAVPITTALAAAMCPAPRCHTGSAPRTTPGR